MIPVRFVAAVQGDLEQLPNKDLQKVALEWMKRLRQEPHCGSRVRWQRGAQVTSLRRVYFDEDEEPLRENFIFNTREGGPRYVIIYQLEPRPERPEVVRILTVGPRRSVEGEADIQTLPVGRR